MGDVSIGRSPVVPKTNQATEIGQQVRVDNRKVSVDSGALNPIREQVEHVDNAIAATPNGERTVSLAEDDPTMVPISWFTDRLPSGAELGSKSLAGDMKNLVSFAQEIDQDILRASELLEKSEHKPLNEKEQREVNTLLGAGKYNLAQAQRWTSLARNDLEGSPTAQEFVTNLQERLANRHMDLADLMCLYDLDQTPPEQAVSRADRIDHNLVAADAAIKVVKGLVDTDLPKNPILEMVDVLEDHRVRLGQAKDVAIGSTNDSTQILPKEMWGTSFNLTKSVKSIYRDSANLVALQGHWDSKAAGAGGSWLPLAHPKITQEQMLQEFVTHQLKKAGVAKKNMPDLKFQFKDAINRVRNERPWEPIESELHYSLAGASYTAHSKITPAKGMAHHFAKDLPANGINCSDRMQYTHVPNLARTELTDQSGNPLFSALRHGVLDAYDISASSLRKLPDQELRTMVQDLLVAFPPYALEDEKSQLTDRFVETIRTNKSEAKEIAKTMRTAASANMAKELAVAALVSDPDKLRAALSGEVVDLNISSVSLLTPDLLRPIRQPLSNERVMLNRQTKALMGLDSRNIPEPEAGGAAHGGHVSLQVRDASGELRTVAVKCKVRTFNFGVNEGAVGRAKNILPSHTLGWEKLMGWGYSMERNDPELQGLLGDSISESLGGDVQATLTELEAIRVFLLGDLNFRKGAAELNSSEFNAQTLGLEREYDATTENIATLREVAVDAKKIWREGSYNKGGQDPYKMVSRLGVVINAMGENLTFNCKSGKDRTGQLDAELKYLTALNAAGQFPSPGARVSPKARQMRSDFTLNTGNLEMQRMNTGLPGFKLDVKTVPGLANFIAGPEMESMYRGGSDYIKS